MPRGWTVSVHQKGAISLSSAVTCDGFLSSADIRVQTHTHRDHRDGFASSKGTADIVSLSGTRDLLIAELNDDLNYRTNFVAVEPGQEIPTSAGTLTLFSSGHMLGSCQAMFEHDDGYRTGYSGDFAWPITPIEVDELVLDGTSAPATVRNYSQEAAEQAFLDVTLEAVRRGPVFVWADSETMYRAITALAGFPDWPIIVDSRGMAISQVYASYGSPVPELFEDGSEEAEEIKDNGRYVLFRRKGSKSVYDENGTYVTLIPFYTTPDSPVAKLSENHFQVGISNHADFEQTLAYVEATGAQRVLVDNVRGRRAAELAVAVGERLWIETSHEVTMSDGGWGS